jgi:hypothetical protein
MLSTWRLCCNSAVPVSLRDYGITSPSCMGRRVSACGWTLWFVLVSTNGVFTRSPLAIATAKCRSLAGMGPEL